MGISLLWPQATWKEEQSGHKLCPNSPSLCVRHQARHCPWSPLFHLSPEPPEGSQEKLSLGEMCHFQECISGFLSRKTLKQDSRAAQLTLRLSHSPATHPEAGCDLKLTGAAFA